ELVRTDPCGDTLDADLRIDRGEALAGGVYLGPSDVGGAEQDLTLQIGQIDLVGVDEKVGGRVAQAADADDQHMRVGKALLRVDAQLGQQHVPAVTEQLRVVHRRFPLPARSKAKTPGRTGRFALPKVVAYCGVTAAATALVEAMTGRPFRRFSACFN